MLTTLSNTGTWPETTNLEYFLTLISFLLFLENLVKVGHLKIVKVVRNVLLMKLILKITQNFKPKTGQNFDSVLKREE